MQVQLFRNSLATALGVVDHAVPARARQSTLPIIGNVLVEATAAGLTLRATDLSMTIEQVLPADVAQFGVTTASHRLLSEIIGAVDGETISLSTNTSNTPGARAPLVIECGRQTARFSTLSADDFPARPDVLAAAEPLTIGSADLKRLLRLTSLAMAGDTTRPVLHGLLWQLAEGKLTLVAADGYRLSVMSAPVDWPTSGAFVLPAETIKAIESLIGQTEVRVRWGEGRVWLDFGGGIILASQVVAGTFPNYAQLIPEAPAVTLTVRRSDFATGATVAGVFTGGGGSAGGKSALVRLVQDGDDLVVTATRDEVGNSRATLPIVTATRSDDDSGYDLPVRVRVGLNYQYLAELLAAIPTSVEYLTLGWTSPSSPVVVRASGIETFTHVLMPMHVDEWPAPPAEVVATAGV